LPVPAPPPLPIVVEEPPAPLVVVPPGPVALPPAPVVELVEPPVPIVTGTPAVPTVELSPPPPVISGSSGASMPRAHAYGTRAPVQTTAVRRPILDSVFRSIWAWAPQRLPDLFRLYTVSSQEAKRLEMSASERNARLMTL
jgi:hypothetical protein